MNKDEWKKKKGIRAFNQSYYIKTWNTMRVIPCNMNLIILKSRGEKRKPELNLLVWGWRVRERFKQHKDSWRSLACLLDFSVGH